MDDKKTIQTFEKFLGQSIIDINYIETKFHYGASGDWTKADPDLFVLHSPEWKMNFSNGEKWFLTNTHSGSTANKPARSIITVNSSSIAKHSDKTHKAPRSFGWNNILDKEITAMRFYKRVTATKKILGVETSKTYQDNIQIIQLFCSDRSISITTMNGDLGHMTFYPTGYFGDKLGLFFDKAVADSHSVFGQTMKMEMVYEA